VLVKKADNIIVNNIFLADRTYVTVELMVRVIVCLLFVCLFAVCHGCIVAKQCETELKLLLITNIKSHIGFQTT